MPCSLEQRRDKMWSITQPPNGLGMDAAVACLEQIMKELQMYEGEILEVVVVKKRACLSCKSTFASEWAGERVCKQCKQSSAWKSGVAHKPAR
jgi:hypothetical protein